MKMKYLILGAGPSGLTLANRLKQMGETSFFVLEKEKKRPEDFVVPPR